MNVIIMQGRIGDNDVGQEQSPLLPQRGDGSRACWILRCNSGNEFSKGIKCVDQIPTSFNKLSRS
jgi:hypothetical protein